MITDKYFKIVLFSLVVSFLIIGFLNIALAAPPPDSSTTPPPDSSTTPPPDSDTQKCPKGMICIADPLSGSEPQIIIGRISRALIMVVGAVAFLFFVVGGFYWIFSFGNEEKVKRGRDIMAWSLVGIVVAFSAYAILQFVFSVLTTVK